MGVFLFRKTKHNFTPKSVSFQIILQIAVSAQYQNLFVCFSDTDPLRPDLLSGRNRKRSVPSYIHAALQHFSQPAASDPFSDKDSFG